ncbi:hypothetical protein MMC13_004014 [Lambiella insularis]|nr:hypothetical protein [Lambiella insularis]
MEMQFRNLDRAIESQPMPEQFQDTKAWVYCNDCSAKTEVKYHWLGLKCAVCDSYNTAQISITGNSRTNRGASPDELIDTHMVENADLLLPEAVQTFSGGQPAVRSGMIRRPATSEIALDALRIRPSEVHLRDAHSASPSAASWVVVPNDGMQAEVPTDLMDVDGGNDDNEDDVDFWGGESPRERALSTQGRRDAEEMDGSEDESEDDDDDEIMDDDSEDDEDDHMDIFGHR